MAILSGGGAEAAAARVEHLRQSEPVRGLSRALRVAEGFGLYILVCERPSDATVMLDLVRERLQQQGEEVQWVHLFATTHAGDLMDNLERDLLAPLVRERSVPPTRGEAIALHAEEIRPADRRTWIGLFNRMNRARNLVAQRLGVPLVLLITPDNEALFAEGAPDFWSLRSDVWRAARAVTEAAGAVFADPLEFISHLQAATERVCCVEIAGRAMCTGFLVAPDLVMTVHHALRDVIEHPEVASDVSMRFGFVRGAEGERFGLASEWLLDASTASDLDSKFEEGPRALDEMDYVILRLSEAVGHTAARDGRPRGWFDLRRVSAPLGEALTILHHVVGGPLVLSMNSSSVTGYNDNSTRLYHRTNTARGSAGAPCLDAQWNVVAMHHAGDLRAGYNQALPIAAIYDLLRARGKLDEIERHVRVTPFGRLVERLE